MFLFVPSSVDEIPAKQKWFCNPACDELKRRKVCRFGFQVVGKLSEGIKRTSLSCAIHLPNNFANEMLRPEGPPDSCARTISDLSTFEPLCGFWWFAVLHGNKVPEPWRENLSGALDNLVRLIDHLMTLHVPVALENVALTNFRQAADKTWLPETFPDPRVGSLSSDMLEVRRRTGCELLVDIEHLAFAIRYATETGVIPAGNELAYLYSELEQMDACYYHISGSYPEGWVEVRDGKVATHAPIASDDAHVKNFLRFALKQDERKAGGVVLVPEVAGPENPCWRCRAANSQQSSFDNICQMLLDLTD